jgi:hypothetical protein
MVKESLLVCAAEGRNWRLQSSASQSIDGLAEGVLSGAIARLVGKRSIPNAVSLWSYVCEASVPQAQIQIEG